MGQISIHALREEGDPESEGTMQAEALFLSTPSARRATRPEWRQGQGLQISIHALREEGDVINDGYEDRLDIFLSTPSARRATRTSWRAACVHKHFYPRPPRGGRPKRQWPRPTAKTISIHALREEGDSKNRDKISIFKQIIQHSARI